MTSALQPLVIGIGNLQRGDDGVGYRIAEALQSEPPDSYRVFPTHQLMPEYAELIAVSSRVLFIDSTIANPCCLPCSSPCLETLQPRPLATSSWSHHCTPPGLLTMAEALYAARPPAWQLLIPSVHYNHGVELSPLTATAAVMAYSLAQAWGCSHA